MFKKTNPKKILSYALLAVLVIFILVLTWVPLIFDIDNLDVRKWMTNSLINVGIMICAIILGEIFGEDKQKEKVVFALDENGNPTKEIVGGLYQKALYEYNKILRRLTDDTKIIVYFSQFYIWFKGIELKRKKEGFLVDHGFDQMVAHSIVKYIDRDDLEQMRKGAFIKHDEKSGKDIKFRRIHDDEYEALLTIFSTDFQIDAPNYTYYLSAFGDSSSVSTLEQAKRLEKRERLNKTFNRVFKIALALFISFIWGMATVQELTEGGVKEAVVNTSSRMISLVGGLLSGFITSVMAVKLASQKLDNKTQILTFMEIHYNNHDFVPKSYDELVDEEIEKEKEEEAKVIHGEIINNTEEEKETSKKDEPVPPQDDFAPVMNEDDSIKIEMAKPKEITHN